MFVNINEKINDIQLTINGLAVSVPTGYTVAAALLSQQQVINRASPVSGDPRGSYCLMGVCFECLVNINGVANQQACMATVESGMVVLTQEKSHQQNNALEGQFNEL